MDITGIIGATVLMSVTGLIIGTFLTVASMKLRVAVNEKEVKVRELLPGSNCGGCGYAGCDALAKAMANGTASAGSCPVAGEDIAKEISAVLGVALENTTKQVAFVKCAGTCEKAPVQYNYYGEEDCNKVAIAPSGGEKVCTYGCTGYGSCVKVCKFYAIDIVDGIAQINKDLCKACGLCLNVCPRNLIELVPYDADIKVVCNSKDKGKDTKASCQVGCIGCKLCVKVCEDNAITVENNIAHIDYSMCTKCGKCREKCPTKAIQ